MNKALAKRLQEDFIPGGVVVSSEEFSRLRFRRTTSSVEILTAPKLYEEELLPGVLLGEWRCLARVGNTLAVITVTISPKVQP